MFDDGHALFEAVVEYGLEGIVAKRRNGTYGPGFRGWMIASAPALGMMEHPLYDVRVVACR